MICDFAAELFIFRDRIGCVEDDIFSFFDARTSEDMLAIMTSDRIISMRCIGNLKRRETIICEC